MSKGVVYNYQGEIITTTKALYNEKGHNCRETDKAKQTYPHH